jgi:hypothetical protein
MSRKPGAMLPPDDELAELLAEHGTYHAVATILGCTESAIRYRYHSQMGLESPQRHGGRRTCVLCGACSSEQVIERFSVVHRTRAHGRMSGGADLCQSCWRNLTRRTRHRQLAASKRVGTAKSTLS